MPNFKELIQKANVFKNNMSLLVSVVIALAAILLFIPTKLMSDRLRVQVELQSVAAGSKIGRELKQPVPRALPEELAKGQQAYAQDANQIARLAEQTTLRELLNYKIFPEPNGTSMLIFQEFARRYRSGMDEMLQRAGAKDSPTDAELERAMEALKSGPRQMFDPYSREARRAMPRSFGLPGRMMGEAEYTVVDGVCLGRAQSCKLYANPVDVTGYTFWGDYKYDVKIADIVQDCWYYQLAYWVIEDVFSTMEQMNESYPNVLKAPVKRLVRLSFTMGLKRSSMAVNKMGFMQRGKKKEEGDRPSYVLKPEEGLTESCTGRASDENLDVVHFNFAVVVDAEAVLPFMKELCSAKEHKFRGFKGELAQPQTYRHNQITILESTVSAVDREDKLHSRYRYSDDAVVELDLICEYVFNRKAYDAIKPKIVKEPSAEGQ